MYDKVINWETVVRFLNIEVGLAICRIKLASFFRNDKQIRFLIPGFKKLLYLATQFKLFNWPFLLPIFIYICYIASVQFLAKYFKEQ